VDVPDNWEDDDNGSDPSPSSQDSNSGVPATTSSTTTTDPAVDKNQQVSSADVADDLSNKLDKLNVK